MNAADAQPLDFGNQPVAQDAVADEDEPDLRDSRQDVGGERRGYRRVPCARRGGRPWRRQPRHRPARVRGGPRRAGAAGSGKRRRPCRCRRSRYCSGRPTPAASACSVMASQTLTIAWHRRAAHRSRAMYRRFCGRLEGAEGQSVDGVDHGRHPFMPGRGPADDARLRAVRVHDLGLEPSECRRSSR